MNAQADVLQVGVTVRGSAETNQHVMQHTFTAVASEDCYPRTTAIKTLSRGEGSKNDLSVSPFFFYLPYRCFCCPLFMDTFLLMKVVLPSAALDWNYLDLNGSSPGACYYLVLYFFIPPSGKITITLEWNINLVVEKEKDGQLWGVQASEVEEEIRDNVLFLDRCCSQIAADGGEWVYLLTIEYVGNGSLKMTDGQAWMKIFVFVR